MSPIHDEILSTIERRGLVDGVPVEDLDTHVADVLGVPPDHYAAWRLVCGAIASYASVHAGDAGAPDGAATATIAGQLSRLWEQLGRLHRTTVAGTVDQDGVRELISELFVLTDWLLARSPLHDGSREARLDGLVCEEVGRG